MIQYNKTYNGILHDTAHRRYQHGLGFQNNTGSGYVHKCNYMYAHKGSIILHRPIFTKLTSAEWHYEQTSCTEFTQIRQQTWNLQTEIHLCPSTKYGFQYNNFHEIFDSVKFCGHLLFQNFI